MNFGEKEELSLDIFMNDEDGYEEMEREQTV